MKAKWQFMEDRGLLFAPAPDIRSMAVGQTYPLHDWTQGAEGAMRGQENLFDTLKEMDGASPALCRIEVDEDANTVKILTCLRSSYDAEDIYRDLVREVAHEVARQWDSGTMAEPYRTRDIRAEAHMLIHGGYSGQVTYNPDKENSYDPFRRGGGGETWSQSLAWAAQTAENILSAAELAALHEKYEQRITAAFAALPT